MDQERQRIYDDLRGLVAGEVRCDDLFVRMYSSDASIYEQRPLAVVRPRHSADVVACVQYAAENHLPIHPRGAGSTLAGGALGPGIVLDFSRYMRRVVRVDADSACVQPGVVLAELNRLLARHGQTFGPDPHNAAVTTMGSAVAIDAAGSRWMKYGSVRQHVRRLQIVLADGTLLDVGREPLDQPADDDDPAQNRRSGLVRQLSDLLLDQAATIKEHQPRSLVNSCGYQLADVLAEGRLDLPRLLAGSEGTLALITELTVATQPLPTCRGVALLMFDRLESAAQAMREILPLGVTACDLLDRRHLSLAREADVRYDLLIPAAAEALLLVECEADRPADLREKIAQLTVRVRRERRLAIDARQTLDREEMELYRALAGGAVGRLYRLRGPTRPVPGVEDVAVPPDELPEFLVRVQNVLKRLQVTAALFAHAGQGQLHIRPFLDLADPRDAARLERLAEDLYAEVFAVGGTISGEHGVGLARTLFVRRQYGPLYDVLRQVKRIFDPQGILNPGKVVADSPPLPTDNLRATARNGSSTSNGVPGASGGAAVRVPLQLNWMGESIEETAEKCNGCGACRTQLSGERMCPIFRFLPREEASPRAKANLMRAVLSGTLESDLLPGDQFKEIADLCVNCHMCRLECPAQVDIPKLMTEAKAAHVAHSGLSPSDWLLTRLDLVASLGAMASPLVNWALGNRQARWVIEKVFGIAQGRKLPRIAHRTFLRRAARRRLTRPTKGPGCKVVYFVDTYANHFDPLLGESLVAVLEHNGVAVYVEPRQAQAGMAMISMGALDRARRLAAHNVAVLAEAVRQGYHIVATEPSAALCLTREYPALLDDDEADLVARNASEACTFLWRLHLNGQLQLDFSPVNLTLAYHMPCHLKALETGSPGENLLRLIPGLTVLRKEAGCSGMAGTFGLKRKNYRTSLRAGWELISQLREPNLQAGATECSTCKMQMEQGTTKPTIHPLKIMAVAYGLMPKLAPLLTGRGKEFLVT